MNKKFWYVISLMLVASLLLAACATPAATTQAPAATEAPATTEAVIAYRSACTNRSAAPTEAPAATEAPTTAPAAATGEVYFLNFKPEVAEVYQKIADAYKKETGNTLKVVTAAAGTYEQTLKSEIAKSDAPVLFQINGPIGYQNWKDYTADLKDTELYKHLSAKSMAVTDAGGVYGIPYAVEGYGIIYNNAIMDKYFATDGAKAKSMD